MCWKKSLTVKLTNCPFIFLHYLIELLHTSNIILRLFVSVIIRIDRNVWLECMVIIKYKHNIIVILISYGFCTAIMSSSFFEVVGR